MSVTDTREVEWQFDAVDLGSVSRHLDRHHADHAGVVVADAGAVTNVDLYLDTEDHRLHRAGYALRLRRVGRQRRAEATLKSIHSTENRPGLRNRVELAQAVAGADPEILLRDEGVVSDRVNAVAGHKPLLPLFVVRTRRRSFSIAVDGNTPGVLALDESTIEPAGGTKSRGKLSRVEVEVQPEALSLVEPFVEELRTSCGLQPATLSKYEAGLLVADLKPPQPERFIPIAGDPDDLTAGAVALDVVRQQFSVFVAKEPGTRLGDDSEELHDMRVASRRLRAALSLFSEVLPTTIMQLAEELRWIGSTLGKVRDLDVQLEQLVQWRESGLDVDPAALEPLQSLLDEQWLEARAELLAALDSRRYERFVDRFGRALRSRPRRGPGPWSEPVLDVAHDLLEPRFRKVRKAAKRIGPHARSDDYHRLRIRAKRLRYALEFLTDAYSGETRPLIKRIVALQDILGAHQDAEVAIGRLRGLATDEDRSLERITVFAMGEIAQRYRHDQVDLRAEAPRAYRRVKKSMRSFWEIVDEHRPTHDAPEPPDSAAEPDDTPADGTPAAAPTASDLRESTGEPSPRRSTASP